MHNEDNVTYQNVGTVSGGQLSEIRPEQRAGALRGAGDTRFPLIATLFSLIGVRCGLAAIATYLELPVAWVYAALMGDYLVKASMLAWRFRQGRWKSTVKFTAGKTSS